MDPAVRTMVASAGLDLNATYNLCFPIGLRTAMSFYVRMIIYTTALREDAAIIGFNFLRAAADVNEPAKETHARSAYMYARGAIAMLAFKNGLFTAGDRPGLVKLIDDLDANVILQLIILC